MKRGKKKVSSVQKTFIMVLAVLLFIELIFLVDYSFTGNIISKTLDKTFSVSEVEEFQGASLNPLCVSGDHYCPFECNDWRLDEDCGTPKIYNFMEHRTPEYFLNSDIIHWDDTEWRTYQPLIDQVNSITSGLTDDYEKAVAIANWVKQSRPYGFPSPANEGKSIIEIFNSPTGVCMDAGLITVAMFRIAGIPSRSISPPGHEFAEAYIDERWIGFDSTFGNSDAWVTDPITSILATHELMGYEDHYVSIFNDGSTYNITNITYYKTNLLKRDIFKDIKIEVAINWSINSSEPIIETYCEASSPDVDGGVPVNHYSPFVLTLNSSINDYFVSCGVIFESDPLIWHYSLIYLQIQGDHLQIDEFILNEFVKIETDHEILVANEMEWGTVLIPHTSAYIFKNTDDTYSLSYDPSLMEDFVAIVPILKADNLDCGYYTCSHRDSNDYSTQLPRPAIVGYGVYPDLGGSPGMPPDHYNGFIRVQLPEGRYRLDYIMYFYPDVLGHYYFTVEPNSYEIITPSKISHPDNIGDDLFQLLNDALYGTGLPCSNSAVSGQCSGTNYCVNGQFVNYRCDKCGCSNGQTCEKIGGSYECTGIPVHRNVA